MTMLHIQLDDATAEVVRKQAKQAGKTLEAWATDVIHQQVTPETIPANGKEWITKFLENADEVRGHSGDWVKDLLAATEHPKGNSGGWKFNREEIYER